MIFRKFHFNVGSGNPFHSQSPISGLLGGGISSLVSIAMTLTALGILMLLFPIVLAIIVASLFFAIAFVCLAGAWRLFRVARIAGRPQKPAEDGYVQVQIIDNDENRTDCLF